MWSFETKLFGYGSQQPYLCLAILLHIYERVSMINLTFTVFNVRKK